MPETEEYHEQLDRLHSLTEADEPPLWQLEHFGWPIPEALNDVKKYTAGKVTVSGKDIEWSVLSRESADQKSWRDYVPAEIAKEIVRTLERLGKEVGIGQLEEISFCTEQPTNPNNQELANGVAPFTATIDEHTGEVIEIPSGSVLLFPNALTLTPYRNSIPEIPHVSGVVAHEWAHQFMTTENTALFTEWIAAPS